MASYDQKTRTGALLAVLVMSKSTEGVVVGPICREEFKRLLDCFAGFVCHDLLLCNEYLVTENRILRNQLEGRLRLSNDERISLAGIGKQLGRKALEEVAQTVRPETLPAC